MNKFIRIAMLTFAIMLLASPLMAQEAPGRLITVTLPGAFGVGLIALGSGLGIGKLAASAVESMARQPEVAGNIQTAMIIAAALIEGFTFYAILVCGQQNPWAM